MASVVHTTEFIKMNLFDNFNNIVEMLINL